MTRTTFNRDNILSTTDRIESMHKCLKQLSEVGLDQMQEREAKFVQDMLDRTNFNGISERQLAWLRDLVEKYCQ